MGKEAGVTDQQLIVQRLLDVGRALDPQELVFSNLPLVGDLISKDPFAFLLAASVDRGMAAETAWRLPARLRAVLGHLDPEQIAAMTQEQMLGALKLIDGRPRYVTDAARTIVELARQVTNDHGGDVRRIWRSKSPDAIKAQLQRIHGVGPGIAAMVVLLLNALEQLDLSEADYRQMDPKPDVHVRRVFGRLGLTAGFVSDNDVIAAARRLHPRFPGQLDAPAWHVGRNWCHADRPDCNKCPIRVVCPTSPDRSTQ